MPPKRVSSKLKNRQIQTKMLEDQTKKMEEKLSFLRQQVEEQKKMKQANPQQSTINRWRKATGSNVPLRDYAKKVLNDRKEALNKYGIDQKKIINSKSFEPALSKIKSEKMEAEEKNPTRLPFFEPPSNLSDNTKSKVMGQSSLPIQSISNNFFKAKIATKQLIKTKTLAQFLQENYLLQYLNVLNSNNIIQLDDLHHLTRQKMTEMNIKPGHQIKIIKRLKQQNNFDGKNKQKQNTTQDSPKKKLDEIGEKVSFGYGDGDVNEYAEIEKQEEQREIKEVKDNINNDSQNLGYDEEPQNQQEQEEDPAEYEDTVLLTVPFAQQTAEITEETEITVDKQPYNCFSCYRKNNNQPLISTDSRKFCGQKCLDRYLALMQKTCPECSESFFKFDGYHEEGLWFCSIKCSPNRQKIQQMFLDWKNTPQDN